jgi:hypothetical protein
MSELVEQLYYSNSLAVQLNEEKAKDRQSYE